MTKLQKQKQKLNYRAVKLEDNVDNELTFTINSVFQFQSQFYFSGALTKFRSSTIWRWQLWENMSTLEMQISLKYLHSILSQDHKNANDGSKITKCNSLVKIQTNRILLNKRKTCFDKLSVETFKLQRLWAHLRLGTLIMVYNNSQINF